MKPRKKQQTKRSPKRPPRPEWHAAVIPDHHRLHAHAGVVSVAIGLKEQHHKLTRRFCVKIYVSKKLPPGNLTKNVHLPKKITVLVPARKGLYKSRSLPTDVVEIGAMEFAQGGTQPFPRIPIGAQIGTGAFGSVGPGTEGCVVRRRLNNALGLLTAGHVISRIQGPITPGVPMYQPDIASPNFLVGPTITGFVGNNVQAGFYMDVAVFSCTNPSRGAVNQSWDPRIPSLNGSLSLADTVTNAVFVHKVGAATDYTLGRFSCFHPSCNDPNLGTLLNVLEFVVDPWSPTPVFADLGDSGAIIVSRSPGSVGAVVGVLFARSPDKTRALAVPFEYIQRLFGVDVV